MRIILAALVAALLVACGTTAQQLAVAQEGPTLTVEPVPPSECHIVPELNEGVLALRASTACTSHTTLPARIHAPWGVVMDGGVYAHNTTFWAVRSAPGVYEVRRYDGSLIATVEVPE